MEIDDGELQAAMYGGSTCGKPNATAVPKLNVAIFYGKNVKGLWPGDCTGGGFGGIGSLWLGGVRHTARFGRVCGAGPHGLV